jgi:hypothetical protein
MKPPAADRSPQAPLRHRGRKIGLPLIKIERLIICG